MSPRLWLRELLTALLRGRPARPTPRDLAGFEAILADVVALYPRAALMQHPGRLIDGRPAVWVIATEAGEQHPHPALRELTASCVAAGYDVSDGGPYAGLRITTRRP